MPSPNPAIDRAHARENSAALVHSSCTCLVRLCVTCHCKLNPGLPGVGGKLFASPQVRGWNASRLHHRMDTRSQASRWTDLQPQMLYSMLCFIHIDAFWMTPQAESSWDHLRAVWLFSWISDARLFSLPPCTGWDVGDVGFLSMWPPADDWPLKWPLADTTGDFIIWNINVYCLIQSIWLITV